MDISQISVESILSGGLGGIGISAVLMKILLSVLQKNGDDCEKRYSQLRKEFSIHQNQFISYLTGQIPHDGTTTHKESN